MTDQPSPYDTPAGRPRRSSARPRRRAPWVAGGAATLALLAGGGALVGYRTGLIGGGGPTPDTVVPRRAVGYVRVDLDPDAGQKVSAFRLAQKLPALEARLGKDKDPRRALLEWAKERDASLRDVDYDTDVAPWVGERMAVAGYVPEDGAPVRPLLALAVSDEEKARAGLRELHLAGSDNDLRFTGGYALITPKGQGDGALAALREGSLHDHPQFTSDMKDLGSDGLASAWVDAKALARADLKALDAANLLGDVPPPQIAGMRERLTRSGRLAAALRLDSDYVELAGIQRGAERQDASSDKAVDLGAAPAGSVAVLGMSDAGQAVTEGWPSLLQQMDAQGRAAGETEPARDQLAEVQRSLGLSLPEDLAVILGRSTVVSVADRDFTTVSDTDVPDVGLVSTTDATRAKGVVDGLLVRAGEQMGLRALGIPLTSTAEGDRFVLATTGGYRQALSSGGSRMTDDEGFRQAVAHPQGSGGLFVDLDRVERYYLDRLDGDSRTAAQALRAVGVSTTRTGHDKGDFSVRLVVN